mgnify:CR=1 FL=1
MKRFLLFAGEYYYPYGGWYDLKQDFDSLEAAVSRAKIDFGGEDRWWHIVDSLLGIEVCDNQTRQKPENYSTPIART